MNIKKIIQEKEGTIVDVRTPGEFATGNAQDSINIPLQEFSHRIEELKKLKQPLVVCCASGMRSKQAQGYLIQNNIECLDGGSWLDINYYQS